MALGLFLFARTDPAERLSSALCATNGAANGARHGVQAQHGNNNLITYIILQL